MINKLFIRILLSSIVLIPANSFAQINDSIETIHLKDVSVTSYREELIKMSTLNLTSIKVDSTYAGAFNLSGAIANTPGVSMLSTGIGISKPVVRGLYGNRILILLSGLRFDNQQWQDEHGMGLSELGLSGVELIKGPMSVLYGTEAIGGIINLIEEAKPPINEKQTDFSVRLNSNTLGGLIQAGYKTNTGKKWFRLRIGVDNNADYSDGKNKRVLNSRFDGYYLKSTFGFQNKKWKSTNNLFSSFNRFGFIFSDVYTFISADERWSRNLSKNPAHLVLLNCLSSENKFTLKNSLLTLNAGVQSNRRQEKEGGGTVSLDMHLLTLQYLLKWEKEISRKNKIILSHLFIFEDNINYGARKIVPDAIMLEGNVSACLETNLNGRMILENGIGAGIKKVKTYFTPLLHGQDREIRPFVKNSVYYNLFSGITIFPTDVSNLKFNIATGVRIPNLAELSSDGLHEGVFTYEIGDPSLKNEQNIAANLYFNFTKSAVDFYISPFFNYFINYVYLSPTTENWFGFPVFRYRQQDANQYGLESSITVRIINEYQACVNYSGMISKTSSGEYTPFIPAQKVSTFIKKTFATLDYKKLSATAGADFYLAQNLTAPDEKTTPSYWLLNAGIDYSIQEPKRKWIFSISANNLLNTSYYDHLSRFKYFDLLNIGRNITASAKLVLNSESGR